MNEPGIEIALRLALSAFDLDVEIASASSSVGIFGPSGAGKTSLLEAVVGWRKVEHGRIRLGERVLLDTAAGIDVPVEERGIGYVPQDALLFPHRTVRGNLATGRRTRPRGRARIEPERVVEVLEIEPLLVRPVDKLSGGERQRVALARALCSQPDHLVLDEPLGALDAPLRRRILPYLLRVREAFDLPLLFVSHDPTEIQALCDVVAVLVEGRLHASGSASEVLRALSGPGIGFTNVVRGLATSIGAGTARIAIAPGVEVQVPAAGLARGDRALFSIGAEEILVATAAVTAISARNVIPARIDALVRTGEEVRVEASVGTGEPRATLCASLTAGALEELGLAVGSAIHLVFKTQSCRVLSR